MKQDKPKGADKMGLALEKDLASGNVYNDPISVTAAKNKFLECYRLAEQGYEIITQKRNSRSVSILSTSSVSAMLDAMKFTITETADKELGGTVTIAVEEVPLYGEGENREAAVEDLINSTLEFLDIYKEEMDLYNKADSPQRKVFMLKLLRCGKDRNAVRKAYGL